MITKITIKNFKKIEFAEFELGRTVVFVGANNSGKTSALLFRQMFFEKKLLPENY
jgi:predicted ATP-dependent endonuclease of OLD family